MLRQNFVQDGDLKELGQIWLQVVKMSDKYSTCLDEFIELFIEFLSIWYSTLGRINILKKRIELLKPTHNPSIWLQIDRGEDEVVLTIKK